MTYRGMPYSASMILAKLAGRKTETRRVVTPQPILCATTLTPRFAVKCECTTYPENLGPCPSWSLGSNGLCAYCDHSEECHAKVRPPRGTVGDRQYWQEAFDFGGVNKDEKSMLVHYKADGTSTFNAQKIVPNVTVSLTDREWNLVRMWDRPAKGGKWLGKPAMFMMQSMSRGIDEIVGLRVERVQEITEEGAVAEGLAPGKPNIGKAASFQPDSSNSWSGDSGKTWFANSIYAYRALWNSINAERGHSWESNPWVWVYTAKEIK